MLEKPCTNHGYPVKHKLKDCDLMRRLLRKIGKPGGDGRDKWLPADQDKEKPAEEPFPEVDRCLVIIDRLEDDCSRRQQKVRLREVCSTGSTVNKKLKSASTPIIFDQDDHPVCVPRPGSYPLVIDPSSATCGCPRC